MKTLSEWLNDILPVLLERRAQRIDEEVVEGDVKVYWCAGILRIDLNPRDDE